MFCEVPINKEGRGVPATIALLMRERLHAERGKGKGNRDGKDGEGRRLARRRAGRMDRSSPCALGSGERGIGGELGGVRGCTTSFCGEGSGL